MLLDDEQIPNVSLPTLTSLNATIPTDLDVHAVARRWLSEFSAKMESQDIDTLISLFLPDCFWRDLLALTWDFRIFRGPEKIIQLLRDQLPLFKPRTFRLKKEYVNLARPYPDFAWISAMFDFQTEIGVCSGVARLVPTESQEWKAHVVLTNLEELHGFPEKTGSLRNQFPNHGLWAQQKEKEKEFQDSNPTVLIIGGGQSALALAVRLKVLDISVLVVEKNQRIGDNWRNRYDALCLHDPVWYDHMPYLPFPPTWPVYTPARKLAGWLEYYAEAMEIPTWTSSTVTHASRDQKNQWQVSIKCGDDGFERHLTANHLVFATGLGGNLPGPFDYPGLDNFKGQYLHSTQHKQALDHIGKKVVVVGSGTSAHDIAKDYYDHGLDVTMVQRGPTYVMSYKEGWEILFKGTYWEDGPPPDVVDRLGAAFPRVVAVEYTQRRVQEIAKRDAKILEGLRSVGFKLYDGMRGTGFSLLAATRGGGYYIDVGASQLIIDKKIKLKNDSTISELTETGLKFADGSELTADVIIAATGLGDARDVIRSICGDIIADKTKPIWGLTEEGEASGVWGDTGIPNMWYTFGNLAMCRFYSMLLALQIKAIEEGIFGTRYASQGPQLNTILNPNGPNSKHTPFENLSRN